MTPRPLRSVVVLVSTLVQGLTLEWFARTLGLATEEQPHGRRAK
jgi:NhaP-type Na+/H+ and K+/H+ antiporter